MDSSILKLMFLTNKSQQDQGHYLSYLEEVLQYGITCVQLREKKLNKRLLFKFGESLKTLLDKYKIPLIINDNTDLCVELDAHGVHLGQADGDIYEARDKIGNNKIIGRSVNTISEIIKANKEPIDYIGVGSIFPTVSKMDVQRIWYIDGLVEAIRNSDFPVVAIGGINEENISDVISSGVAGIAGIGIFHQLDSNSEVLKKISKKMSEHCYDRYN